MKLSKEEIAKVWAMYMPVHYSWQPEDIITERVSSIFNMGCNIEAVCIDTNDAKMHLTPLSEITDEHAVEVAKMMIQHGNVNFDELAEPEIVEKIDEKIVVRIPGLYLHVYFDGKLLSTGRQDGKNIFTAIYNTGQIHQFLISRGYAVPLWLGIGHPANGKTPIDLGIAISKNEVK